MVKIHKLADVQTPHIGKKSTIWQFAVICKDAVIGENCNINCHTFIENQVVLGNNVTIKSGVYIWDGVTIENDVFVGPCVVFTNNPTPRSKQYRKPDPTILKKGASIGANSVINSGITIGKYAMIGMGTVVTKNVPDFALVYGNPGKRMGWVDKNGEKMKAIGDHQWMTNEGIIYQEINERLVKG